MKEVLKIAIWLSVLYSSFAKDIGDEFFTSRGKRSPDNLDEEFYISRGNRIIRGQAPVSEGCWISLDGES